MTNEVERIPPQLQRTVRRVEVFAGSAVVLLLVLTGLGYALGIFSDEAPETAFRKTPFRPMVAAFEGEVDYKPVDATEWRPLRLSDTFQEGDMVRTGPEATVDVLLTWGTGFTIAPGTEFLWKRLQPRGAAIDAEFVLPRGKILATLDDLPEGSLIRVTTPHSTTEVKGTILDVEADEKATRTIVLRGLVEVVDRSDPRRRVAVGKDGKVGVGAGETGQLQILTAEERAKLLSEEADLRREVDLLTPKVRVGKGKVTFSAEEEEEETSRLRDLSESSRLDTSESTADTDVEEIKRLVEESLVLLDRGRVEQLLGVCTESFRAVIWGPMAERTGVAREFSREQGDGAILAQRDVVQAAVRLKLSLEELDVTVDGDLAYVTAIVQCEAAPTTDRTNKTVVRTYSCSARLVKRKGRWLVDLATAMEAQQ